MGKELVAIRLVRIVKDLRQKEMAETFSATPPYINSIENGTRVFREQTLFYGLYNLDISIEDYRELEDFCLKISETDLDDKDKYKFALIKAIGTVAPDLKDEAEATLNKYLVQSKNNEIERYINMAKQIEIETSNNVLIIWQQATSKMPNLTQTEDSLLSLKSLGITTEIYQELRTIFNDISISELPEQIKERCKLLKAIGIVYPELQEQTNGLVENYLNKTTIKVACKK